MARKESVQSGGILLAENWKLWPMDERNWELCTLAEDGRWKPHGRYYSYNTIDQAMLYVIDVLMKDGCKDDALALASAMRQWQQLAESIRATASGAVA